jgi:hypothetical protein
MHGLANQDGTTSTVVTQTRRIPAQRFEVFIGRVDDSGCCNGQSSHFASSVANKTYQAGYGCNQKHSEFGADLADHLKIVSNNEWCD